MDPHPDDPIARRKAEHLRQAARAETQARTGPGWADIHLLHRALPAGDASAVDLRAELLGRPLKSPVMIASMTGGHPAALEINATLARAAERHGVAMGVGSQRAGLREPSLQATYRAVREQAPTAFLVANLGAPQLVAQAGEPALDPEQLQQAVAMIRGDALAIHLNFLQETVQPEGDRNAAGLRAALARAVASSPVPVIAKETGAGISRETAMELRDLGFHALDVGGAGGTSFAAVEGRRARDRGDERGSRLGEVFHDWGIPTAVAVAGSAAAGLPVIATGGVRTGLDAAKAIALGASLVGVASPLLAAALEGDAAVDSWLSIFLEELRAAVFLSGGTRVSDLRSVPRVVLGATRQWLDDLGYR